MNADKESNNDGLRTGGSMCEDTDSIGIVPVPQDATNCAKEGRVTLVTSWCDEWVFEGGILTGDLVDVLLVWNLGMQLVPLIYLRDMPLSAISILRRPARRKVEQILDMATEALKGACVQAKEIFPILEMPG